MEIMKSLLALFMVRKKLYFVKGVLKPPGNTSLGEWGDGQGVFSFPRRNDNNPKAGFDVWGWAILCWKGRPVTRRMSGNVPGLCPLDASSILSLVVTIKNVSRHCQMSPEGLDRPLFLSLSLSLCLCLSHTHTSVNNHSPIGRDTR